MPEYVLQTFPAVEIAREAEEGYTLWYADRGMFGNYLADFNPSKPTKLSDYWQSEKRTAQYLCTCKELWEAYQEQHLSYEYFDVTIIVEEDKKTFSFSPVSKEEISRRLGLSEDQY